MNNIAHIDTHRHLGGCVPPWWVWQTVRDQNWKHIGESYEEIVSSMTFANEEHKNFHRFLDKFKILDQIKWDENLIDGSIKAICDHISQEKLDFCWLDFSINKYMDNMNWHKKDAVKFIHDRFETYLPGKIGLILSLKYESTHASQRQYAKLIDDPEIVDLLFGIDLVGDESYFDDRFYGPIFSEWTNAGKMTRAHTSESQDFNNCYHAIRNLKVTNIAHGINIYTNYEVMSYAKDMGVTFDLGLTSNYLTGVCTNDRNHPVIDMVNFGLRVTIGTDDPIQCNTSLLDEYNLISKLGVDSDKIDMIKQTAIENTNKFINN